MKEAFVVGNLEEFLAHALAIEREAATRYRELAEQMALHNNPAAAELFFELARKEEEHRDRLERRAQGATLPLLKPWEYRWQDAESPEAVPIGSAHYLMTPYHALEIARANERRAHDFFARVAASQTLPETVRMLARELQAEEVGHIADLDRMLERTAPPASEVDEDLDPPVAVD